MRIVHVNNGKCTKCREIWKDAHPKLQSFAETFQAKNPDGHVAWAYRGEAAQAQFYKTGTSNAQFGQSPHNYKPALALDWFRLTHVGASWDRPWFRDVLASAAKSAGLVWGGEFKSINDLPHVELRNWREHAIDPDHGTDDSSEGRKS